MIKFNKYFVLYLVLLLIIGFKDDFFITFLMVLIHESAHYLSARLMGFSSFSVEILPYGAKLNLKEMDEASIEEDIIISLSGPIINLLLAVFFYFFTFKYSEFIARVNIALFIFNMLPAFPLDGGRVVRSLLCKKVTLRKANKISAVLGMLFGFLLMFCFFVTFFKHNVNISLGIASVFIITFSYKEKRRAAYIIMADIVNKKMKFLKRGYIENKSISIHYKKDLLEVLSIMEKNKYNVFTVLDDELIILDIIYEGEIINGLKAYGNITIEQFIRIRDKK